MYKNWDSVSHPACDEMRQFVVGDFIAASAQYFIPVYIPTRERGNEKSQHLGIWKLLKYVNCAGFLVVVFVVMQGA